LSVEIWNQHVGVCTEDGGRSFRGNDGEHLPDPRRFYSYFHLIQKSIRTRIFCVQIVLECWSPLCVTRK
jgi:hypothetical protein